VPSFILQFSIHDGVSLLHPLQMFVGSFEPDDDNAIYDFQVDVQNAINQFKSSGVTNLLIDVTNNGGLYTCLIDSGKI
jgi:hypothetical protein